MATTGVYGDGVYRHNEWEAFSLKEEAAAFQDMEEIKNGKKLGTT